MEFVTTAHGITLLQGNHKKILELKKKYRPTEHGHKVWSSTWLLIDYLERKMDIREQRLIDLGCGWGLNGIYCVKKQGSSVTCVDVDKDVKPYIDLMAKTNRVHSQIREQRSRSSRTQSFEKYRHHNRVRHLFL